jgi:DNA polymerase I-like protein with 3'-5' exonuclease and polymerase domains
MHDVSDYILTANIAEKARGTFVDGYIGDCAIGDRVHCEFHPLRKKEDEFTKSKGTITGRFSGANPNLQNIPTRDDFIGPLCRSMFVADEGAQWWSQDYSQIEYRFLVHYAIVNKCEGFEVPMNMYLQNPNTDFHDMCAKLMYGTKGPAGTQGWNELEALYNSGHLTEEVFKKKLKALRKPAKNLNFGMVYGMGEAKLANQLGMTNPDGKPSKEALQIMKEYHAAAPYIKALNKLSISEAEKNEFVTTILGRRGRFPLWEKKFTEKGAAYEAAQPKEKALELWGNKIRISGTHKALNKKLQGSAADMMKLAMVQLWESGIFDVGNDITCVLTVHDELNGSFVPSARGEASRLEVKRIMENAMQLAIPVLTSGSVGSNWSEAK